MIFFSRNQMLNRVQLLHHLYLLLLLQHHLHQQHLLKNQKQVIVLQHHAMPFPQKMMLNFNNNNFIHPIFVVIITIVHTEQLHLHQVVPSILLLIIQVIIFQHQHFTNNHQKNSRILHLMTLVHLMTIVGIHIHLIEHHHQPSNIITMIIMIPIEVCNMFN